MIVTYLTQASKRWLAFHIPEMVVHGQQFIRISAWALRVKLMQIKKLFSIKPNWYATSFDAFLTTCIFVPLLLLVLKIRNCSNYFPGSSFSCNNKADLRMSALFLSSCVYNLFQNWVQRNKFIDTIWFLVFINNFLKKIASLYKRNIFSCLRIFKKVCSR